MTNISATEPIIEPVSLAQLAEHLTLDSDYAAAQADKLLAVIKAARTAVEGLTTKYLISRTVTQVQDNFKDPIKLLRRPVSSVTAIDQLRNWDTDAWTTVDPANYVTALVPDSKSSAYSFVVARRRAWESHRGFQSCRITYVAGMADSGGETDDAHSSVIAARALVKDNLREAVLQYAAHLFTHRKADALEPRFEAQNIQTLPRTLLNLIEEDRDWSFYSGVC